MNKKTNIFIKFKNSLYKITEFESYMKEGVGRALIYALLLSFIYGSITGVSTCININKSVKSMVQQLGEDKYKFEIKGGILTSENSPIKIEENKTLIYIDQDKTLDQVSELRNITVHEDSSVLLLKDGISITTNLFPSVNSKYSDILNIDVNNDVLIDTANKSVGAVLAMTYIANLMQTFIYFIIDSLFVALMVMVSNFLLGLKLRYSEIFSLVIYASTLPMLLVTVLTVLFPEVYFNLLSTIGALTISSLVLTRIRREMNENMKL